MAPPNTRNQYFWRDNALPFVELRRVADGHAVCYERHSHDTFSIGTVKGGYSTYWNRGKNPRNAGRIGGDPEPRRCAWLQPGQGGRLVL